MATNTTNIDYPRGSEWRKWDLHIHTPASDGTGTPDEIVDKAIASGLAVIAITDHHSVDYIDLVRESAKDKDLTVISGIEFRSEYGSKSVHFIAYFPDSYNGITLDTRALNELILSKLDISRTKIVAKGKESNASLDDDAAFKEGMFLVQVDFKQASHLIHEYGGIISVHNGAKENGLDREVKHFGSAPKNAHSLYESLGTLKDELLHNYVDICDVGKGEDASFYLDEFNLPSILTSDAHKVEDIGNRFTWIKADPTFEGLKQILYEPSERVKIQNDNPGLEREKSPFTLITIPQKTKVFKDDDDIFFDVNSIPLNNGLVSIIGGRGTGKSQLINYLAAIFGKIKQANNYNLDSDIEISRQVSLTEEARIFKPTDYPSASFMFIEQSQIKNLVADRDDFSKNILETIGVTDIYEISKGYSVEADLLVNEYYRIKKVLFIDGKTVLERKESINREIKRYEDFIQNITSEQNKKKLEDYKGSVELLHRNKNWQQQVKLQCEKQKQFVTESNAVLQSWNEQLNSRGIQIPLIDISETQNYLEQTLLSNILESEKAINERINLTKNEFKDYKGDLSTLLSRVSSFQEKLNSLKSEKTSIEKEEQNYIRLSSESFKNLGAKIRDSIQEYTSLIGEKWKEFKGEYLEDNSDKKRLLNLILQNGLEVEAAISFDVNKMYELLLDKLDKRKYSIDKLQDILKIKNLGDFFSFVNLDSDVNVFLSDEFKEDLRNEVLYHCYKRYTDFISIGVNVTLDKKSITKLSYGQQGTIYLRLQIAANIFSDTIIYDQPEDDLDNDFITKELVTIFKTIKLYRQVIIVSHNANLVVNADSEQIIVAENKDGVLSYMSGSLENPQINAKVCQILEGGKEAFDRRKRKYRTGI